MPAISTSSLPDIVFMLLFFFMVTTTMRQTDTKVKITLPEASEVAKLERKDLAYYINIGSPINPKYGDNARIQLNDSFKEKSDIYEFIKTERDKKSEADQSFMTVVLRCDENVHMGIVTDVKQELRRCSALRIMYSAHRGNK